LINTHHHGDHTFGNHLFCDATIVAQDNARAALLAFGTPGGLPFWTEVDWGQVSSWNQALPRDRQPAARLPRLGHALCPHRT
jgi:glyoxylase-like metal-dependent hydrolase (beta-lactamase superfamily II)